MQIQTLRPGFLVQISTSIKGNVKYSVEDLGRTQDGVSLDTEWKTHKRVDDVEEADRATKARSKARSIIGSVCASSAHVMLCLEAREPELRTAIKEAQAVVAEFNRDAALSQIVLSVWVGKVSPDDALAIRMINQEMRNLMEAMQNGMRNLDVKAIREAADTARSIGQALTPEMQERVADAIELARKTAREIKKAGEAGAIEVDRLAIAKIESARTAFLDIEDQGEIGAVEHAGRAVDLEPEESSPEPMPAPAQGRMFDVDETARNAGEQIEQAYPFGYRSSDVEA